jgi:hypothetical protein
MPHPCPHHCPSDGGGSLGVVIAAVAAVGGTGAAIGAFLNDIIMVSGVTVSVLLAASIWYLVHVLRRDQFISHRAEIYSQAVYGESRLLAFDVRAPTGRRLDQALIAEQRHGLPDGSLRNPVLRGEVALTGEPVRVRLVGDQRPEDRG